MPRSETVLQVFVASPGDVRDEREVLESVVAELNRSWAKTLGVRLELVRWETSTHPAVGSDPQSVINAQIGDEYDVFIGILWGRIGTETPRSESGTLEEFERAHERWKSDPSSLEIMFYFKDAPIKPSEIDGVQNEEVQNFKRSLGEEGVYHWTFEGADNFESLARTHLSAVAQKWARQTPASLAKRPDSSEPTEASPPAVEPPDLDDDLGFLDYIDRFNLSMEQMNTGLHAVADATASIGEHMNRRAAEIQAIGDTNDPRRYKDARRTIKASAEDMAKFAGNLEGQLPTLESSRKEAFESMSKALSLYEGFESEDRSDIDQLGAVLKSIIEAAEVALESMEGFESTVRGLPRLTSDLNRVKRRVGKALDEFASEIKATIRTATSLLASLP